MQEAEEKDKWYQKNTTLIIIFAIIVAVIGFIFLLGRVKLKKTKPNYDDINFDKLPVDIETHIINLNGKLIDLNKEKTRLENKAIKFQAYIKWLIIIGYVLGHVLMFLFYSSYDLNYFIQINKAILIVMLFVLFMISEEYSNVRNGFVALNKYVKQKVFEKARLDLNMIERLKVEIHILESMLYTHPSLILNYKSKE